MTAIFWALLRSVGVPYVAYMLLRNTFLEEKGAILAVGIALTIVTLISIVWNLLKIFGNALLLRGEKIIKLIIVSLIQIIVVAFIWFYYYVTFVNIVS